MTWTCGKFDIDLASTRVMGIVNVTPDSFSDGGLYLRPGDAVSVFAPLPGTHVSSKGLAWPLDGVDLTPLWRGSLNCTTSDSFMLRTTHPILLYRPY